VSALSSLDDLPLGWVPIPHAVDAQVAPAMAQDLLAVAAKRFPGLVVDDTALAQATAAITRLPVDANTLARVWHLLGRDATGLTADLSVGAVEPGVELDAYGGGPFNAVHVQRQVLFANGLATLAFVAPDEQDAPLVLLRAQCIVGDRRLVADVLDSDLGLLGRVLDDVTQLVGLTPIAS